MQSLDYTTLVAVCQEIQQQWIPSRVEQVYQRDRHTLAIALRTLKKRAWLTISWHPQASRLCIGDPPPRERDTFTFSDQLRHQLKGYALIGLAAIAPWERVLDLQFAQRPTDPPVWHLFVEIMGKYSNVILTDAQHQIIAPAHQVTESQSSVRTVKTGQPYELPPPLTGAFPQLDEPQQRWQERVSLIPKALQRQLLQAYRGLSPMVANAIISGANLDPQQTTDSLTQDDWQRLFEYWQKWLYILENKEFQAGWTEKGYTVLGWNVTQPTATVQELINHYYRDRLNQQRFQQLHHQLKQKLSGLLNKLDQKAQTFENRLQQSDEAELYRKKGDLLMAHLSQWQPGMTTLTLTDFESEQPLTLALNPEKNAVQNAQAYYKQHQKLKRAQIAVKPLLEDVKAEIAYLEQVEASLSQLDQYETPDDLQALAEIQDEIRQQGYLKDNSPRSGDNGEESQPYHYQTPSGFDLWIGRNNRQNDELTFRKAGDYDLWFHTQESAGSHVLLRLDPGTVPDETDLQYAADWAAYHSRARQSEQVPVVYTQPKYVYKPKGAKPGMVIYQREQVLWGKPHKVIAYRKNP